MSLINGMEDVIEYIKNQDKEIAKLKEENDILNAYREEQTKIEKIIGDDDLIGRKVEDIVDIAPYIEKLKEDYAQMKDWADRHQEEIHKLKDEKNTLKEIIKKQTQYTTAQMNEIEKLKEEQEYTLDDLHELVKDEGFDNDLYDEENFDVEDFIHDVKENIEELEYEIEEQKENINNLEEDIEEHKEENKQLKVFKKKLKDEITKFKKELKEEDEDDKELIKLKNNNEIVNMMFIDEFVRDEIEQTIDEGINQYTFNLGTGYYKEHKLKYVKDIIMPHLTTYYNGDGLCSSYQNGKFYYKMNCMMPYDIETNNNGTYTFNRIDDDDDDE